MSATNPPRSGKARQNTQRAGKERIESLGLPKPRWVQWWQDDDKSELAVRVGIALLGAVALLVLCQTWRPPFPYRIGMIPDRELLTRVRLEVPDESKTEAAREMARRGVLAMYVNRPEPIDQLKSALRNELFKIISAESFDTMPPDIRKAFASFYEGDEASETGETPAERFSLFKSVLAQDPELKKFDGAISSAILPMRQHGVLRANQHTIEQGDQRFIRVFTPGQQADATPCDISTVRIAEAGKEFETRLRDEFRQRYDQGASESVQTVAKMIVHWFVSRLPENETLEYDDEETEMARQKAAAEVPVKMRVMFTGKSKLASAGQPLTADELSLLRYEWQALLDQLSISDRIARVAAYGGLIIALYLLCGAYIYSVDDRRLLQDPRKLAKLITLMVAVISCAYWFSQRISIPRTELIPLVVGSMIAAVVYGRELALLLMASASVSLTLFLGLPISDLVVMAATCTTCTLLVGRIRTRTHLLYVGSISALITMATVVGVGIVTGQMLSDGTLGQGLEPIYLGPLFGEVVWNLLKQALIAGCCIVVPAAALTPFLPLVEKGFGVLTDLSLLELGDASDPLLRRLAQRAPGTYNHSINVASIAEAAADEIGANGLLVRVGAYFHDIGKMFKPEYFIENQSGGVNQHDSLQPAMSTLVIIAHVKDGADLARSHHLPEPIIDFILQHHGTTLVEYFYREATRRSEEDPNREAVSDKDFRYPGPKPKTLEAAVLMLADTVESASRTLVDPTPARIQGLVDSIAQKKVADGQFDECGMTFRQLHRVRQSLVKSLTAIYHARIKYPGQQSA
ncbi:HD family phosphohydrolase [Crateriforma conspicua]|uniref:HD domain-containing protein n=1 Tax=Crateriforma conspicua TaxID=2527996 RepID=A0A5C5Y2T7_9PLAN|nr:HDIG domain-containing metalloprotein [Crateriforma conspicua]QDV64120.1 hypothetical protein Mal65_32700 [Crateriforma conspicua]TWT69510.1 hypothetical protein Pan14r_17980 [Crateriforma conspicua]